MLRDACKDLKISHQFIASELFSLHSGGLGDQIRQIREVIELPLINPG
jgi:ATP-dependent 26S proteasome regulatory subunit